MFYNNSLCVLAFAIFIGCIGETQAQPQPTIISTAPPNGGSVSTNGPVVFTFSTGMDTVNTYAQFFDGSTGTFPTTSNWWSAGDAVLTCTPTPPFLANKTITWFVSGMDTNGADLGSP